MRTIIPYNFDFNLENVISILEKSGISLSNWLRENHMKASADKCRLLVSSDESCTAKIEDFSISVIITHFILREKSAPSFYDTGQ